MSVDFCCLMANHFVVSRKMVWSIAFDAHVFGQYVYVCKSLRILLHEEYLKLVEVQVSIIFTV